MTDDLYDLNGLAASLQAALEEELAAGGAEVRAPAVELSLPARPEHGDVTTNAALITAKRAGRVPRELAEAVGARWLAGRGRRRLRPLRGRRPRLPQSLPERRLVPRRPRQAAGRGRRLRPRRPARAAAPEDERRVREREPHRAAARGPRPLRFLRRRAVPHPRLRRPRRDARVLRQRLRHADAALRPVARRPLRAAARPRHAGARGGLPGRLPARPRRRAHRRRGRPLQGRGRGGRAGHHGAAGGGRRRDQALGPGRDPGAVPRDARAPARPFDVWTPESSLYAG